MKSASPQSAGLDIRQYMQDVGMRARRAAVLMSRAETAAKDAALLAMAAGVEQARDRLIAENAKDLDAGRRDGLDDALLDRLTLNAERIAGMGEGLRQNAASPFPFANTLHPSIV